jgi:hypothetical protein
MIFPWAFVKCHDSEHLSEVASYQELRSRVNIDMGESKIKNHYNNSKCEILVSNHHNSIARHQNVSQ